MAPKKPPVSQKKTAASPRQQPQPPDWPPFKPLSLASDLSLSTVVDFQIIVVKNFWTKSLCKNYVSFLKGLPLTTTPGVPKKGEALRVNDRYRVIDEGFANRLWAETGLKELVCGIDIWGGEPIGLNPAIRIYRYSKGQFFDCHYDESNILTLNTTPTPIPAKTTWTVLLYLTSPGTGCQGGETVFYPDNLPGKKTPIKEEVVVELETGMMLLHKHGDECMLHEGREVKEGEKWVIRTDLCVKR